MAFPWAAAMSGGFSASAGLLEASSARDANAANATMNEEQMKFQSREAVAARDWSERMSNSAYQRQVADMKAAGINPMVAFNSGGASSSGGVTAGSGGSRSMERVPSFMNSIVTSALDAIRTVADASKAREAVNLMEAEKRKTAGETANLGLLGPLIQARTNAAQSLSRIMDAELPGRKAGSTLKTLGAEKFWLERKFPKAFGAYDSIMDRLLSLIHSGADASRAQSYSRWADRW